MMQQQPQPQAPLSSGGMSLEPPGRVAEDKRRDRRGDGKSGDAKDEGDSSGSGGSSAAGSFASAMASRAPSLESPFAAFARTGSGAGAAAAAERAAAPFKLQGDGQRSRDPVQHARDKETLRAAERVLEQRAICTLVTPVRNELMSNMLAPEVKSLWFSSAVSRTLTASVVRPFRADAP